MFQTPSRFPIRPSPLEANGWFRLAWSYPQIFPWGISLLGAVAFLGLAAGVTTLVGGAVQYVRMEASADPDFRLSGLFTDVWQPMGDPATAGIGRLFLGSAVVLFVSACLWLPLSLASGLYLAEFATPRVQRWRKSILGSFTDIPPVVFGYLAVCFIVPAMGRVSSSPWMTACSSGMVLAVMILPLAIRLSTRALRSVPNSIRDSAYSLGATHDEVVWSVVLPAARKALVRGWLLAAARVFGESIVVTMAILSLEQGSRGTLESTGTLPSVLAQFAISDSVQTSANALILFIPGLATLLLAVAIRWVALRVLRRRKN